MIVFREKTYSELLLDRVTRELDRTGYQDYDVMSSIPGDSISLNTDLNHLRINVPVSLEYSQYGIDDFIRSMVPFLRTRTTLDRNIFEMVLSGKLTEAQYIKLIKYIMDQEGTCIIVNDEQ